MDKKSKRKVAGGAVYVFCAFMLVSILVIAMLTAISNRKNVTKTPEPSVPPAADGTTAPVTGRANDDLREREWERDPGSGSADSDHNIVNGTEPADLASAVPYSYNLPVRGEVSKSFSDKLAVWSSTMNDYRAHLGVDFDVPQGEAVMAFADGTVSAMWNDPFMGYCVCIEHTGGMKSYYMNLSGEYPPGLEPGAAVIGGQMIGSVGCSAKIEASDPTHLHFEVTVDGAHVDPLDYLEIPTAGGYEDED